MKALEYNLLDSRSIAFRDLNACVVLTGRSGNHPCWGKSHLTILVLFSHGWRAGQAGGAETHVTNLIQGLSGRGHRVVFVTGKVERETLCRMALPVTAHYELPFQTFNPLDKVKTYQRLEAIVAHHQVEMIHAHHRTGGYCAELICRRKEIPYVVTVHDPWRSAPCKRFHGGVFRHLIAVSEFIRQGIIREFRVPEARIKTIHNGVDPARFMGIAPEDARAFRSRYGIQPGEVVLSLVGRISRIKGHYDLIGALRLLPRDLNYRCLIVGEGSQRKRLEKMVHAWDLSRKVTFCGYQGQIPVVMAASDVILLPSYREPFGLTLVEAMLSHKAVLATNMGGIPEIVTHNRSGILFEPGEVAGLAGAIRNLVSDGQLRSHLAEQGYRTAVDKFLLNRMLDETERYYYEILGTLNSPADSSNG